MNSWIYYQLIVPLLGRSLVLMFFHMFTNLIKNSLMKLLDIGKHLAIKINIHVLIAFFHILKINYS